MNDRRDGLPHNGRRRRDEDDARHHHDHHPARPHSGVVSDDEDAAAGGTRTSNRRRHRHHAHNADTNRDTTRDQHQRTRNHGPQRQQHEQDSPRYSPPSSSPPTPVYSPDAPSPYSPNSPMYQPKENTEEHNDTRGHFQGAEGSMIGDYRILREVGKGTFGRVVECLDTRRQPAAAGGSHGQQDSANNVVAIKVVRNVKRYFDSALIEGDIIEDVNRRGGRGISHCAIMFHTFSFQGHYCMVFESLGPSLYDFLKRQMKFHPFPIGYVRDFARQLLETLEFLHGFRLIHTDLKLENILLLDANETRHRGRILPASTRIKVIDFGGATYDYEKKSSIVNTRQYRAPEVILGVGWSMPSDLWSLGKARRKA